MFGGSRLKARGDQQACLLALRSSAGAHTIIVAAVGSCFSSGLRSCLRPTLSGAMPTFGTRGGGDGRKPNAHLRVMNSTRKRCDTAAGDGGSTRGLHTLAAPRARGRHGLMLRVHAVQASTLASSQVRGRALEAAARARTLTPGMCARATAGGLHPLIICTVVVGSTLWVLVWCGTWSTISLQRR